MSAGVFVTKNDRTPSNVQRPLRQELLESVQIVVFASIFTWFSDINGWTWILGFHELKLMFFIDIIVTLNFHILFHISSPILFFNFLYSKTLLCHYYLFVKILFLQDVVDVVRCKVISKELVINCGTHQDYSYFWILSNDSFHSQQDKVSINISLMNFIQNDEGVFFKKLCAVNQSLHEYAVGDEHYSILWINIRLHSNLITDLIFLVHLPI